jgi:tetratricopeptide (TPR) repeat protein
MIDVQVSMAGGTVGVETAQNDSGILVREVLYAHAADCARCGDYPTAERVLKQLLVGSDSQPDKSNILLLLGKIYAQQRRYDGAMAAWRAALQADPHNQEAMAAIARAHQRTAAPEVVTWKLSPSLLQWAAGIVSCVLVAILVYSAYQSGEIRGRQAAERVLLNSLQNHQQELVRLHGNLNALSERQQLQVKEEQQRAEAQMMDLKRLFTEVLQQSSDQADARFQELQSVLQDAQQELVQLRGHVDALSEHQQLQAREGQQYAEATVAELRRHFAEVISRGEAQAQIRHQALLSLIERLRRARAMELRSRAGGFRH